MDIQETIDIRYEEIEGLKQNLSEDHYMNPEQEDELEELITKAIKFGELCAKRDAKAQAVPEGFVLMPLEIDDFDHPITKALEKGIVKDLSASVIYKAMIEAQEQSHE
jgi:hypothetical protein